MSCESTRDFCVGAGETFDPVIRWATNALTSTAITGITQAAPAVVTAILNGAPDGWPVAVVSAKGMTQINAGHFPPTEDELIEGLVLTANTIALTTENSADYSLYTSGGFLVYYTPVTLSAATGQLRIWDNPERTGTPLATLAVGTGITLDNTAKTISIVFSTTALTWTLGYYALDMTIAAEITRVLKGTITIS